MEWPQGFGSPGQAECLVLDGMPSMSQAGDIDCEVELHNGYRLGGSYRLAVYAVSGQVPPTVTTTTGTTTTGTTTTGMTTTTAHSTTETPHTTTASSTVTT